MTLRAPVAVVKSLSTLGERALLSRTDSSGGKEVWRRGCAELIEEAEKEEGFCLLVDP